ncbi:thioredoxin [Tichowtungia aerotolerans]|uniref:Thioredoxin n=1 Tax=Tichowtungia aerotolerans TaxID=2697043 RepID=A0A6P1M5B2_9BACT|nr:thioredoxin [Tichowtungia aerotolerans]QHI69979.1 thioredoxin [Tichowtungia aerotolerans]
MSDKVKELNTDNFNDTISSGTVLVDFWAPWCGPCKMQTPILDKVAEAVGDKAVVAKVNVDENSSLAAEFGVRSIPTLLVFKDGKKVQDFVGVQQENTLVDALT